MTKRAEFSRKVRAAASLRSAGKCESCRAFLKVGEAEYDHVRPCELGGEATLENCQVICRACHKSKTGHDIGRIRKADRQRDKSTGAIRPKQTIPHRPKVERVGRPSLPPRIMFWPIHGSEESGD